MTIPLARGAAFDPDLDLLFERVIDIAPHRVWDAWTRPEQVVRWFTPAPWTTAECTIELHPGGAFRTLMRSPEGQEVTNTGCYLELVPGERLVWTTALGPGFRPVAVPAPGFVVTATIALAAEAGGTRYTATVRHADAASRQRHEAMGFQDGWGKALDQLVAMAKSL